MNARPHGPDNADDHDHDEHRRHAKQRSVTLDDLLADTPYELKREDGDQPASPDPRGR